VILRKSRILPYKYLNQSAMPFIFWIPIIILALSWVWSIIDNSIMDNRRANYYNGGGFIIDLNKMTIQFGSEIFSLSSVKSYYIVHEKYNILNVTVEFRDPNVTPKQNWFHGGYGGEDDFIAHLDQAIEWSKDRRSKLRMDDAIRKITKSPVVYYKPGSSRQ